MSDLGKARFEGKELGTIVITGGGTGGHLFPALAVSEALRVQRPDLKILFVGREHPNDRLAVEKRGLVFQGFPLLGLKRKLTLANGKALWFFLRAVIRSWFLLRRLPKGVVFGVGGYVAAPAMTVGWLSGWQIVLHEQNSIPGLVNRILASHCDRVFLTYEVTKRYLKSTECRVTGFPLREEMNRIQGEKRIMRSGDIPNILLIGGSQGARRLVEIALQASLVLESRGVAFCMLVQTGDRNYQWASSLPRPSHVTLIPFIEDMAEAYRSSDVVISRAGSGSLSEIAFWGLPSILVPFPFASENHQAVNAEEFAQAGAAQVLEENRLSPEALAETLMDLIENEEKRFTMGRCAAALARGDAAKVIADELIQLLEK